MGTCNGDLIQNQNNWNTFAYTLVSMGPTSQMPIQSYGETAEAGDKITMHCTSSFEMCIPELR